MIAEVVRRHIVYVSPHFYKVPVMVLSLAAMQAMATSPRKAELNFAVPRRLVETANATPLVDRTTLLNALDPGDRARNHTM